MAGWPSWRSMCQTWTYITIVALDLFSKRNDVSPFWYNVFLSFGRFAERCVPPTIQEFLQEPLLFHHKIRVDGTCLGAGLAKNGYNKGWTADKWEPQISRLPTPGYKIWKWHQLFWNIKELYVTAIKKYIKKVWISKMNLIQMQMKLNLIQKAIHKILNRNTAPLPKAVE